MATLTVDEAIKMIKFIMWLHEVNMPVGSFRTFPWLFEVPKHRSTHQRYTPDQNVQHWDHYSPTLQTWLEQLNNPDLPEEQRAKTLADVSSFFAHPNLVTIDNYTLVHAAVIYLRLDLLTMLHQIGARFDDEPDCEHLLVLFMDTMYRSLWSGAPEFTLPTQDEEARKRVTAQAVQRALEIWTFLLVTAKVNPGPSTYRFTRPQDSTKSAERSIASPVFHFDLVNQMFVRPVQPDLTWQMLEIMFQHKLVCMQSFAVLFKDLGTAERLTLLTIAAKCRFDFNQRYQTDEWIIATHTVLTWVIWGIANARRDKCSLDELKLMLDTVIVTGHADPNAEIQYRIHPEELCTSTKHDDRGASEADLETWRREDHVEDWGIRSDKGYVLVTDKDRGSFTPLHYLVAIVAFRQIGKSSAEDIGQIAQHLILRGADVTRKCIVPNIKDGRYTRGDVSECAVTPLEYLEQVKAASNNLDIQQHLAALQQALVAGQQSYTAAPVSMGTRSHTGPEDPAGAAAAGPSAKRRRPNYNR